MVKLFAFLTRREDLSHEEFLDHWFNRHAPLIAGLPNISRHVVRYVQHPRVVDDGPLSGSEGCDGVTEQWFNSMDDFVAFVSEPDYAAHIAPDEAAFLNHVTLRFVVCEDSRVVIEGGA